MGEKLWQFCLTRCLPAPQLAIFANEDLAMIRCQNPSVARIKPWSDYQRGKGLSGHKTRRTVSARSLAKERDNGALPGSLHGHTIGSLILDWRGCRQESRVGVLSIRLPLASPMLIPSAMQLLYRWIHCRDTRDVDWRFSASTRQYLRLRTLCLMCISLRDMQTSSLISLPCANIFGCRFKNFGISP